MEKYELDAVLDSLKEVGGSGTWHISLYVRPDRNINHARGQMQQEFAEAESIKSDDTRERVQSSLGRLVDALDYKETPNNGLVVFTSPNETHVLDDLPFEVSQNLYRCDSQFVLEPLRADFDTGGTYGLVVVERGEAAVGVLSRGRLTAVVEKESRVMGKTQAGGQSQARFERLREQQKHEFFKDVQEIAYGTFKGFDLDGVLIGGTLNTAKEFSESYTNHDWDVLGTYSVQYAGEQGLEELVQRAQSELQDAEGAAAREAVERFFEALRDGEAAYGREECGEAADYGAIDTLLLSSSLPTTQIREWTQRAEQQGGETVVIPQSFEQGEMFDNISNGYGAILRFEI